MLQLFSIKIIVSIAVEMLFPSFVYNSPYPDRGSFDLPHLDLQIF